MPKLLKRTLFLIGIVLVVLFALLVGSMLVDQIALRAGLWLLIIQRHHR